MHFYKLLLLFIFSVFNRFLRTECLWKNYFNEVVKHKTSHLSITIETLKTHTHTHKIYVSKVSRHCGRNESGHNFTETKEFYRHRCSRCDLYAESCSYQGSTSQSLQSSSVSTAAAVITIAACIPVTCTEIFYCREEQARIDPLWPVYKLNTATCPYRAIRSLGVYIFVS